MTSSRVVFTDRPLVVHASRIPDAELDVEPLPPEQILVGPAAVHHREVTRTPDLGIGIWQHDIGTSTDVETDEVFVVLSGRAAIDVQDGPRLDIGPGDLVLLPSGARTVWTIHETLRKVYVARR
jgi:hypothetical protein